MAKAPVYTVKVHKCVKIARSEAQPLLGNVCGLLIFET